MGLKLDGISEIDAHVSSNLCYLICLKHLIGPRAVTNRIFSSKAYFSLEKHIFTFHSFSVAKLKVHDYSECAIT